MFNRDNNVWQVLNNLPEQGSSELQHEQQSDNEVTIGPECHRLCIGPDRHHHPIPVLASILTLAIIQLSLLAAVFVVPVFHDVLSGSLNIFSLLQYVYIICWALITVVTWHMYSEFYQIWLLGYHFFFQSTQHMHKSTFYIYTGGLALVCVLGSAVGDYCTNGSIPYCGDLRLSPINYQQLIVVLLTLPALLMNVKLFADVYKFNKSEDPADVLVDDLGVRLSQTTNYIGIGRPSSIHMLLEVQGAMIGSLRHRVDTLNRQIAVLANTLEGHLQV